MLLRKNVIRFVFKYLFHKKEKSMQMLLLLIMLLQYDKKGVINGTLANFCFYTFNLMVMNFHKN